MVLEINTWNMVKFAPYYLRVKQAGERMNPKTLSYIIKRILLAVLTVWIVLTITFFVMHFVPGGPFASEKAITPAAQAALEAKYGLDKPLMEQYWTYLVDAFTKFDFGPSLKQRGRMVIDVIKDGLKTSAKLGIIAAAWATIVGVVLGAMAALRRNTILDRVVMVISTAFVSMPSFIMGSLLLLFFSVKLGLVPANGETAKGLILPIITLGLSPMANIIRLTRSSMLDVLGQDYIKTAKAKGLSTSAVLFKHALPNALIPVVTYLGPMAASVLTGSFVIETIFAIPGLGSYFVTSIYNRDYTVILGITLFYSAIVILMNMLVDLIYPLLDPRIKLGERED